MTLPPPRTLPELFLHAVERHDRPDLMRYKAGGDWAKIPAREFREEVELAAHGLIALGIQAGDRVALLSENRPGWALADLATLSAGAWVVPIYTSLPPDEVQYLLEDSGARACVVSTAPQLAKVMEVRDRCPSLSWVISLEPVEQEEEWLLTARQLVERGREARVSRPSAVDERRAAIDPEETATILYTSGTTGRPKGVMLSHRNLVTNTIDALESLAVSPSDLHLSWLPLSHSFERTAGYYIMLHAGVSIAYAESIEKVVDNMREVRATVTLGAPRLYEKMYAAVLQSASEAGGLKKAIAFWARRVAIEYSEAEAGGDGAGPWLRFKRGLADRLVFSKIRDRVGGSIRFFVSGSAPLAPVIMKFFYAAGMPILEGYGLTETSPVVSVNTFEHMKFGTVGKTIRNVEARIDPDPERPDGDGEILIRGPNVMQGYYRLPEKTAEVMTPDGWFRTGDIGIIDSEGFLAITDRKKDLIKTSGGKYIAPQPIENELKTSRYVTQAVVVGNKRKYASVLIVPNFENLNAWARQQGLPANDPRAVIGDPRVQVLYEEVLQKVNADRPSYETIKKFRLLERDFTIDAGELTPTLKVKRATIEARHSDLIDTMYEEATPAGAR
ncbi:MAG TPA: long-chain fatty acid--CoA ligase [Gemmatimonadota bacterium]|nr:long-chain fatty acid--CoA ligase [Gemmatimonadota bacterium]